MANKKLPSELFVVIGDGDGGDVYESEADAERGRKFRSDVTAIGRYVPASAELSRAIDELAKEALRALPDLPLYCPLEQAFHDYDLAKGQASQ